jgi:hypothetical protein
MSGLDEMTARRARSTGGFRHMRRQPDTGGAVAEAVAWIQSDSGLPQGTC